MCIRDSINAEYMGKNLGEVSFDFFKSMTRYFVLVLAIVSLTANALEENIKDEPKVYNMDIAQDYITNWGPLIKEKGDVLRLGIQTILQDYGSFMRRAMKMIPRAAKHRTDYPEFRAEIKAIASLAGVSFQELFMMNFLYELTTFCTGVIAKDKNGVIMHGRNLDFFYQDIVANLTAHVNFYKNGVFLFKAEVIVGSVGILTGYKPGVFGISINQRPGGGFTSSLMNILRGRGWPVSYWLRYVLTNAETYDEALKMLSEQRLAAGVYYVLSGINEGEGVIITRSTQKIDYLKFLSESEDWFIVQTNSDEGVHCDRKEMTEKHLNQLGQENLSLDTLLNDILSAEPTRFNATIYSIAYSARLDDASYRQWY
eukprot:TRINITY_DN9302_c0_g4_i1.p1 TRINITY_DN9302_c0_g4~~TRINITY_DN9302_c0_g4_i1.p1  ORF type:complete len:370 (-),score=45.13 TRINITY_DN9302_c0_g4_i1:120-1229(-)